MSVIEKLNSIKNGEMTAKENVESFIKVIDETNEEIMKLLNSIAIEEFRNGK